MAASFSLRPQDSLWDGAHDARLTGDVVDETPGCEVDRADWSGVPDDLGDGVCPHHKLSLPYRALSSCPFAQVFEDDATRFRTQQNWLRQVRFAISGHKVKGGALGLVATYRELNSPTAAPAAKIRRASCSLGIGRLALRRTGSSRALVREIPRTRA